MPSPIQKRVLQSYKIPIAIVSFSLLVLLGTALLILHERQKSVIHTINYSQLYQMADNSAISSVAIIGDTIVVQSQDGSQFEAFVASEAAQQDLIQAFRKSGAPIEFRPVNGGLAMTVLSWLIPVATLALVGLVLWRVYSGMNGYGESFSPVELKGKKVTFADVAGVDEAKIELAETIEFLRDPARFGRLGGRAPRGILLYGPPGTGKTLLARAAANEAGVPFLSVSGSSFQEKFAGVGAARVRRLFTQARKLSPCVIFIDEIDALGRHRGRNSDSASADQDQTLNQLLVEMDGFEQNPGIVIIGSTNRQDILDRALTRPGRFDREITVNLADMRGREAILKVHGKGLLISPEVDFNRLARGTPGFSGAELANLLNEAAIAATLDESPAIALKHIEYARDKILMGAERQGFRMDEEERFATAVHEAGHVAVGLRVKSGDPIHKVSILPRGRALGVTQSLPERDRLMKHREYLDDQIAVLLGGRAAEQILLSTMTAGAANDIERAVEIARRMVSEFGMSELGPIHLGGSSDPRSQTLLDRIENATNSIIRAQLGRACEIVEAERESIARLVDKLMDQDTLDADEIRDCFELRVEAA